MPKESGKDINPDPEHMFWWNLGFPESFDRLYIENFILIDAQRRIRGIYNGLNKMDVAQLIADINTLKAETTTLSSP